MLENIRLSFQGIWAHKMRSFLTMLGIIIGIAAIIAIVSTIKGTSEQIKDNLVGSGDNVVQIQLYEGDWNYYSGDNATPENMPMINEAIKEEILEIDEVVAVSAYRYGSMYEGVNYKGTELQGVSVYGVDDNYFDLMEYRAVKGRLFVDNDRQAYKKYIILDNTASNALFAGENPIGKTMEIKGDPYIVIGVVDKMDGFSPKIETMDDYYTYYSESAQGKLFFCENIWPMIYAFDEPYNVVVKAENTEAMTQAGKKTADLLNGYMPSTEGEESTYKYKSEDLLEKAKALQDLSASTSQQLIWIASISLLVGGIGVMNIMLVSVTERTREIGLKKALGARKKVILAQFLTEASVLTSLGGIIGVGAGIGLAYLISGIAEVPVAISGSAIVISVAFSMVIGVVFGLIPSVKAANLNPIDALRYE
ncbi:MAG: ABC transporter permease [Clostridium sp.]|nr:ABC transporter permease [Clostridium sp.]MCM1208578.1 ABC transporter permease [Ruminococcus sp.]